MVRFDLGPLLQGQMRIAKLKSAYNLFIIAARGLGCETNLQEIMDYESYDVLLPSFSELSFQWIQFASVHQCARSSL